MSCPHGNPIGGCDICDEVDAAFEAGKRSSLAEQPAPVSQPNRVVAYSAAMKLRELGYEWMNDKWKHLDDLAEQPAQRTWVSLTDAEKYALADDVAQRGVPVFEAICESEAKLKEKNGA